MEEKIEKLIDLKVVEELIATGSDARDEEIQAMRDKEQRLLEWEEWQGKKQSFLDRGLCLRHLEFCYSETNPKQNPAMDAAAALGVSTGLFVMSGNVGSGKTQAAHYWLLDAFNRKPREWHPAGIRMATTAWFARTSRYAKDGDKFDLLAKPRKLVLDDLGVEFADKGGSFLVDLDELLDLRWSSKSATLLLTNLDADEFKSRYRKRLYDRARGEGRWFDVKHPSMRG